MSTTFPGPGRRGRPDRGYHRCSTFPSPEREGHLVLVQNTLPFAQPSALFSDGLVYRFRLRRPRPEPGTALEAVCRRRGRALYSTSFLPDPTRLVLGQEGLCTTPTGTRLPSAFGDEHGGSGHGVGVFAGPLLGSVHHGRPGDAEDDRDGRDRVHRSGRDLHGRQETSSAWWSRSTGMLFSRKDVGLVGVVAETLTWGSSRCGSSVSGGRGEEPDAGAKQFDQVNVTWKSVISTNSETGSSLPKAMRAPTGRG